MKKFWKIALFTALAVTLVLTGCSNGGVDAGGPEEVNVTVTFNLNGQSGTPPPSQTFAKGGTATRPASNPSAVGYTFANWYSTQVETPVPSSGVSAFNFSTAINADITLYAGWNTDAANYWYVKFYDGNTVFRQQAVEKTAADKNISKPSPDPVKANHAFRGWTLENPPSETSTLVIFPYNITADVNLYAIWESTVWTVTFSDGGHPFATSEVDKNASPATVNAPTPDPVKEYNTFKGWSTDLTLANVVTFPYTVTGDITLHAIWEQDANYYFVTFYSEAGTEFVQDVFPRTGTETADAPNPPPTKSGYAFMGWTLANPPLPASVLVTFPLPVNDNINLYAIWAQNWVVTFYNESAVFAEAPVAPTGAAAVNAPSPAPTKTGYTLKGWSTVNPPTEATLAVFPLTITVNNTNLYALWEKDIEISDIILINNGLGDFQSDWFLDLVKAPSGKPAIKIEPDTLGEGGDANSYRMMFNFDPSVDVKDYGYIECDIETDGDNPSGNAVLSLFIYDEAEPDRPIKLMDFSQGGVGTLKYTFGKVLHFKSYILVGFEYYNAEISSTTNLYITRLELGGTPVPEPELGEEVPATNAFLTFTAGATSGSSSLSMSAGAGEIPGKPDYKKVYVYFDPLGADFNLIEVKFSWDGGGNFSLWTGIDATAERSLASPNYLGYKGWGAFSYTGDPSDISSQLSKATLKCITFEVQVSAGSSLSLAGVVFTK
jgi:uncharacterized repeat protein (TIGR02543 family)